MNNFAAYRTWHARLTQWAPDRCPSRLKNMTLLIVGLLQAGRIHTSAIVRTWPLKADVVSLTRRLSRFLDNPAIRVREWYRPVAQQLLAQCAATEVRLIIDGTKVGFHHQLLMVALAFHHRALPLAWCWVKGERGHSSATTQLALLNYVRSLLPRRARVLVVGDAEFCGVSLMQQFQAWRWKFVLRQKGSHQVKQAGQATWGAFVDLLQRPGQQVWAANAQLTLKWKKRINLLAYWAPGEKEPWLLATNLPEARLTRQAYARRMWIEEMFGDLKRHGFDLEATHLRHFMRLSRLTLAVALLYVWLVQMGCSIVKAGHRHRVDRRDRRDLSLFRIGWDYICKQACWSSWSAPVPFSLKWLLSGS